MLASLKNFGRAVIPAPLFKAAQPYYHGGMALLAHFYYGRPTDKLVVIGITGTAGKSTTINILATILKTVGYKTGFSTTANYSNGDKELTNMHGLSMPGGFMLQRQLAEMVNRGCKYAIIECTSEGLAQNRHLGIKFDAAMLTSLAPAHLDAHGGYENYRAAKAKLFSNLASKGLGIIGVNLDTADVDHFLRYKAHKKFGVTLRSNKQTDVASYEVTEAVTEPQIKFKLNGISFELPLIGEFNIYNTALAAACADMMGVPLAQSASALSNFSGVQGRLESVPNNKGIKIFVDYAPEPSAMENSLKAVSRLPHHKLIHVFGTTGGHRDKGKRFDFGRISAEHADTIIITNDDVYDSDPEEIAINIRQGIDQAQKKTVTEILTVLDRRQAIHQALSLAQAQDIVLITGKGSEQFLVLPGDKRVVWDEPRVVKEELQQLWFYLSIPRTSTACG